MEQSPPQKILLPRETRKYTENIFTDRVTQGLSSDIPNGLLLVPTLPQIWNKTVCYQVKKLLTGQEETTSNATPCPLQAVK